MNRKEKQRSALFEKYSYNLALLKEYDFVNLEPDIPESYICPLCIRIFTKYDLDQANKNSLTLEDIPPKSLGGKPILLTCEKCNNKSGSTLDEELRKKLTYDEFNKKVPLSQVEAKMTFASGLSTSCTLSHREGGGLSVHMFKNGLNAKKGKRKSFPRVEEDIRANGLGKMHFSIKTYKPKHQKNALLRIAYLLAFAKFGYAFLFNDHIQLVREQILNPEKDIIKYCASIEIHDNNYDEGIYLIVSPKSLRAFLVIFKLINGKQETFHSVALPGFDEDSLEVYERMKNFQLSNNSLNFQVTMIPDKDYFRDKELCLGPQMLWEKIKNNNITKAYS